MSKVINTTNWKQNYLKLESIQFLVLVLSGLALVTNILILINNPNFGSNSVLKLVFFILGIFAIGGQQFFAVMLRATWFDAMVAGLVKSFFKKPENQFRFYKLEIPPGYSYGLDQLKNFFKTLHFAHKSPHYSVEKVLNQGLSSYSIVFDIVIQKPKVELYLAFANQHQGVVDKALEFYLPGIGYEVSKNPFESLPKNWNDYQKVESYDCVAGFALGYSLSNVYYSKRIEEFEPEHFPINSIIRNIQDNLQDQKIYLQYVLTFENRVDTNKIKAELNSFRQQNYNRFSLRKIKPDLDREITGILLPDIEKKRLNAMDERLSIQTEFISANIKIVGLSSREQYIQTENLLEQVVRENSKKNRKDLNEIEKIHYTATNQRYYNLSDKQSPNSVPYLNSTYWFPPTWLEPFVSNLYDNVYYYNENKYRRQVMYRTLLKRSVQAPWHTSNTLLDLDTLPSVFQIPTNVVG